eukprot:CAMPEP_0206248828 /NCGR_PEP_ID=MMETSP0047_2-20121206/20581_1 /ASSEMBLY_ACC=CAM_ASM_000192 /TAXON_ID=195065 /ORGANISM="Chroomonas mesostigmatica_cf, Strain CCMP1168" /LENGTH=52 /DNA_ID=CAMNT_0053674505 /DNA_START=120 /DNA_END=279 /DNA_ORIENTATION=-
MTGPKALKMASQFAELVALPAVVLLASGPMYKITQEKKKAAADEPPAAPQHE